MRHRREKPATAFRGGEMRWLITGVMMLVVLGLLMSRLREPGAFNWLSDINRPAAASSSSQAAPLPEASGPTDEDPDQAETAREEFPVVSDGKLNLSDVEMAPYNRLVFWVKNQSFARLWGRAKKNLAYTDFYDEPGEHRGELAAFDVSIRLVRDARKNDYGIPLHEVWATAGQSGDRLYDFIVMDLPAKIPIGQPIQEKAKFAGYFLKLQGYQPGLSKPGQAAEKAPLLIGRLEWTPTATSATDKAQEWIWGLAALGLIAVVWAVRLVFGKLGRGKAAPRGILSPSSDAVIPVDRWLEQSGFASPEDGKDDGAGDQTPSSPPGP